MKFSHKVIMLSAAALMGVSPLLSASQTVNAAPKSAVKKTVSTGSTDSTSSKKTVTKTAVKKTTANTASSKKNANKASSKKTSANTKKSAKTTANTTNNGDTIVIGHNSYVYYANGKRNTNYKVGKKVWPVIGKGAKINAYGTKMINGKLYYYIGNSSYIKAVNIATINGKKNSKASASTTKAASAKNDASKSSLKKIKLIHNAYIYDKNGSRIKSAGKLAKNSTISYVNVKTIKGKKYFNLGKGQYVKTTNADYEDPDDIPDSTYIQLVHNSIIYDENGNAMQDEDLLIKGAQYQALAAKQINGKWYYQIGNDGTNTQWIKAVNAAVVSGPALIKDPDFSAPTVNNNADANTSVVTLSANPNIYDIKGNLLTNINFSLDHSVRVDQARYIWIPSEKRAVLAYRLASYPSAYVLAENVNNFSGKVLTPINSETDAEEAGVVATAADKQQLNAAISSANSVKNSDAYKLASNSAKSAYDTAITNGQKTSTSTTSTLLDVHTALDAINKAQRALTGQKIVVSDLNNLTASEQSAIISAAAKANNVSESSVQFINNNTQLQITNANGYQTTVSVNDYATTQATSNTNSSTNN